MSPSPSDVAQLVAHLQPPIKRRLLVLVICAVGWLFCFWRFNRLLRCGNDRGAYVWGWFGFCLLATGLTLLFLTGIRGTWGWWL